MRIESFFQSAFHRGTHCYSVSIQFNTRRLQLSVRFSSRHSLLLRMMQNAYRCREAFSPLFIAALTATKCKNISFPSGFALSVRFSSRHSLLRDLALIRFTASDSFSPLFIAALTATKHRCRAQCRQYAFSPLFIAALTATVLYNSEQSASMTFQSAFHRGTHCYIIKGWQMRNLIYLSVRFSSRHSLLQRFQSG